MMDIHSSWMFGSLVIYLVGIEGLVTRLFKGTDVGTLFNQGIFIIAENYPETVLGCAAYCAHIECDAFLFRETDAEWPDDHCYSSTDHYGYTGHLNITVSGWTCQRWDSQLPHAHDFNADLFPESTLEEAQNYCRDANELGSLWCRTTNPDVLWDSCNIIKCMATGNNCRLYSTTSTHYSAWTGYSYFE